MKYNKIIFFLLLLSTFQIQFSSAQDLKKWGDKLEKSVDNFTDKAVTKINEIVNSTKKQDDGSIKKATTSPFPNINQKSNSFARGDENIFMDNFNEDKEGNMAKKWTSNGMGNVTTVEGFDGKWLQMYNANNYKIKPLVNLPEDYTIEFDVLTTNEGKNSFAIDFGFDYQKGVGNYYYLAYKNPINIEASYYFNWIACTSTEIDPSKKSEIKASMNNFVNDIMHVKIAVVGTEMQTYINDYKILDTEMVNPSQKKYFYIGFETENDNAKAYFSNFRIDKIND